MNFMRVSWGMSGLVWLVIVVLCCFWWNLPAVVISDIRLPGMDGMSLLKRWRANGRSSRPDPWRASWGAWADSCSPHRCS